MRVFQTGFLLSLYLFILTPPQTLYHGWDVALGLGAIVLFAGLHLLVERPTWQLYPAYAALPLLFVLFFYHQGWIVMVLRLVGTLGLTLSVLMTIIVPVPHLPGLPSGSFKVGTIVDCWTLRERVKEQTWRERKMWLKVWYPADGADPAFLSCPPAPYLILKGEEILGKNRMVENLFDANPFGKLLGEVLTKRKSNARYGSPLSPHLEQWPVIVYEHAQNTVPEKNTALCERLASRGYVVFAVYNEDLDPTQTMDVAEALEMRQTSLRHVLRRIGAINAQPELPVGIRLPSRRFFPSFRSATKPTIIEKLGDGSNIFANRLDVLRGVGLFGHGLGGTAVMLACYTSPEPSLGSAQELEREEGEDEGAPSDVPDIACGVALHASMDSIVLEEVSKRKVTKPLLLINSNVWPSATEDMTKQASLVQHRDDDAVVYLVTAKGTAIENFTDFPWLFATRLPGRPILLPRRWMTKRVAGKDLPLLGPVSPHDAWRSWTGMVEYFFDKHLLLPCDASVESYGSMLLFDPLLSIKIYSNMELEEEIDRIETHHQGEKAAPAAWSEES